MIIPENRAVYKRKNVNFPGAGKEAAEKSESAAPHLTHMNPFSRRGGGKIEHRLWCTQDTDVSHSLSGIPSAGI
jgi:hypothetical protein